MSEDLQDRIVARIREQHEIAAGVDIYLCDHLRNGYPGYMLLWAGDKVRFATCRLCSSCILGSIVSARIEEVIKEQPIEKPELISMP